MSYNINVDYGSSAYWEKRYERDHGLFDWYFDWEEFFCENIHKLDISSPVLVVGCGNSELSNKLEGNGISPVISTDISKTCCFNMSSLTGGCYLPMDVCQLQFRDNIFPCVIDKGTLDAILCQKHYEVSVTKMMLEISRVLSPNGIFIEITFGKTPEKINILDSPDLLSWSLEDVHEVKCNAGVAQVFVFRKFKEIYYE